MQYTKVKSQAFYGVTLPIPNTNIEYDLSHDQYSSIGECINMCLHKAIELKLDIDYSKLLIITSFS